LSSYQSEFDSEQCFVGIELKIDCPIPDQYISIDHHNINSNLPSSIEQVAELLGIDLTREQKLVAANDKGYISELIHEGASQEEILLIREKDRRAQGITKADELLGQETVKRHLKKYNDLLIVHSLTPHFSVITDLLFPYKELLIIHEKSFTYYGNKALEFSRKYAELLRLGHAFCGGQPLSFFGVGSSSIPDHAFEQLLREIIQNCKRMNLISKHIFLFPFQFHLKETGKERELILDNWVKTTNDSTPGWVEEYDDQEENLINYYNESKYFHRFTHEALFSVKLKPKSKTEKENGNASLRKFFYKFKTDVDMPTKLTTPRRFILTTSRRSILTTLPERT
jgi:hypothetical protein